MSKREGVDRMLNTIFSILFIAAVILVVVTVFLLHNANRKKSEFLKCTGTITGFHENTSEMRLSDYETKAISPIVEYMVDGQRYEFVANFYSTSMKVGDKYDVLYDPADHSAATLQKGTVFAPVITGGIGVVLLIISLVYFFVRHKGII